MTNCSHMKQAYLTGKVSCKLILEVQNYIKQGETVVYLFLHVLQGLQHLCRYVLVNLPPFTKLALTFSKSSVETAKQCVDFEQIPHIVLVFQRCSVKRYSQKFRKIHRKTPVCPHAILNPISAITDYHQINSCLVNNFSTSSLNIMEKTVKFGITFFFF